MLCVPMSLWDQTILICADMQQVTDVRLVVFCACVNDTAGLGHQVSAVPGRLLRGGREDAQRLLLEAQRWASR